MSLGVSKSQNGWDMVKVIVDSGAEESVCPKDWGSQFGLKQAVHPMRFKNASGGVISHYGEREVLVTAPF